MGKVKELQMNVQYIMNVLSANGEQKASEAFETVLETLGYKPAENVRDGDILIPVPQGNVRVPCSNGMVDSKGNTIGLDGTYGVKLNTVGDLRNAMSELDDDDQLTLVTIDLDTGDEQDHYPMHLDVIDNIRLTDDTIVREVQFVQRPNSEPDTRDKQRLVDALIDVLAEDINKGDVTVLDELLLRMPFDVLKYALPEDMWADFEEFKGETYQTEDGHTKADCPKCEASEHIDYLNEHGECDICRHEKKD
jgi:hypothetical protein